MCFDLELTLKVGAFIVSFLLLLKGVYEYAKAQKWKKAEFVSKEIKEFFNDFNIKRALILLDWNVNDLALAEGEIKNKNSIQFTDKLILSAMTTHRQSPTFAEEEVLVKNLFDALFDRLIMFHNYIKSGLIETKDIKPYIDYYISILADDNNDRKPEDVRNQIWKYIDEYGYDDLREFCRKFGYRK